MYACRRSVRVLTECMYVRNIRTHRIYVRNIRTHRMYVCTYVGMYEAGMRPDLSSRVYRRVQGDRRASSIGLGAEVRRAAGKMQQLGSSSGQGEASLNKAAPTYVVVRISGLGVRLQVNHMHASIRIHYSYIHTSKIHCRYHIVVYYGDDRIHYPRMRKQ